MSKPSRRRKLARSPFVGAMHCLRKLASGSELADLVQARVIEVDPEQFAALPPAADSFEIEGNLLFHARLPFPEIFISVGGTYPISDRQGWDRTPFWGALLIANPRGPGTDLVIIPFYSVGGVVVNFGSAIHRMTLASDHWDHTAPIKLSSSYENSELICAVHTDEDLAKLSAPVSYSMEDMVNSISVGAIRAMRAIYMLESANVAVVQNAGPPKGHQAHGVPHYDVVVRQTPRRTVADRPSQPQDWSHRWEVRGHYKHYRQGPTFDANPDRRIATPDGECVRIWCPPYVKGPEDKPLIPKRRIVR